MKSKRPSLEDIMEKMALFGLDLDHIKVDMVKAGDLYQVYFFLDILNVLLDSIFQVQQKRMEVSMKKKAAVEADVSAANSSGGEEISKILDYARKTYGRVHSLRKDAAADADKENSAPIKPQKFSAPQPSVSRVSSSSGVDSDSVDHVSKPPAARKPDTAGKHKRTTSKTTLNESEHEINVKIPTSDTTDIFVKVKPLDNVDLRNKRIHVRINQNMTPEKLKSNRIIYGRKSVIGHHLRKTRPPMFSQKMATPKLDKKQLLKNVVEFTEQAKRENAIEKKGSKVINKDLEAKLKSQKLIREKRTNAAQLRKLVKRIT